MSGDFSLEEAMAAMMAAGTPSAKFGTVAKTNPELVQRLGDFDPFKLAAVFGALLTVPELQANCVRLEVLVHLALLMGGGKKKPNSQIARWAFNALSATAVGALEDPTEDLFVRNITTSRGNFRVIEGIWESGTFMSDPRVSSDYGKCSI